MPESMEVVVGQSDAFVQGSDYVLNDFTFAPQMNGLVVRCFAWLPDINRVIVAIPGGMELSVKPSFLRAVLNPDGSPVTNRQLPPAILRSLPKGNPKLAAQRGAVAWAFGKDDPEPFKRPLPLTIKEVENMGKHVIDLAAIPIILSDASSVSSALISVKIANGSNAGNKHVVPLVESEIIAAAVAPISSYKMKSSTDGLTLVQRDTVKCVMDAFEQRVRPGGPRAGFLEADGPGVGKSRVCASVILENTLHGRRRHLWLAGSAEAFPTIQKDLEVVSGGRVTAFQLGSLEYDALEDQGYQEGVCFATYTILAGTTKRNNKVYRRIDQLMDWLGNSAFDGVIVFDNFSRVRPVIGVGRTPVMCEVVDELHTRAPEGRIVYVSASAFSNPRELQLADRLGVVNLDIGGASLGVTHNDALKLFMKPDIVKGYVYKGHNEPMRQAIFNEFDQFTSQQWEGTLGCLKARGRMQCRMAALSQCSLESVDVLSDEGLKEIMNASVVFWSQLWALVGDWLSTNTGKTKVSLPGSQNDSEAEDQSVDSKKKVVSNVSADAGFLVRVFWSSHQHYFNSLSLIAKLPAIQKVATEASSRGESVVVSLFGTGDDFEHLSPRETLTNLVSTVYDRLKLNPETPNPAKHAPQVKSRDKSETSTPDDNKKPSAAVKRKVGRPRTRPPSDDDLSSSSEEPMAKRLRDSRGSKPATTALVIRSLPDISAGITSAGAVLRPLRHSPAVHVGRYGERELYQTSERLSLSTRQTQPCPKRMLEGHPKKALKENSFFISKLPKDQPKRTFGYLPSRPIGDVRVDHEPVRRVVVETDSEEEQSVSLPKPEAPTGRQHVKSETQSMEAENVWIKRINEIRGLPTRSALDMLIDALGGSEAVAEITARRTKYAADGEVLKRDDVDSIRQYDAFTKGKKNISILAEGCSTGISFNHPKSTATTHIFAELPLVTDKAYTQATRTYNALGKHVNYVLVTSALGGDRFLASAVLEEFKRFGLANVKGVEHLIKGFRFDLLKSKQSIDQLVSALFGGVGNKSQTVFLRDFDSDFLKTITRVLEVTGWTPKLADKKAEAGLKFLTRLRGSPVELQEPIFAIFISLMDRIKQSSKNA